MNVHSANLRIISRQPRYYTQKLFSPLSTVTMSKAVKIGLLGLLGASFTIIGIFFFEFVAYLNHKHEWETSTDNPNRDPQPISVFQSIKTHLDSLKVLAITLIVFGSIMILLKIMVGFHFLSRESRKPQTLVMEE